MYDSRHLHSPLDKHSRPEREAGGDFQRSEVCRSQDAVFTAGETWKKAMIKNGWR